MGDYIRFADGKKNSRTHPQQVGLAVGDSAIFIDYFPSM